MSDFRARVYGSYVNARQVALAPKSLAGLGPRQPYIRKLIREHFPTERSARILDLGCGHGAILHFAHEAGYVSAWGVDTSLEQVRAARALGIEGVVHGDIRRVLKRQRSASLDAVISFDIIEHFRKDELTPLVDSVLRVLAVGGRWVIHIPNAESVFGARMRYWDFTHECAFTRSSISQILLASGFKSVTVFEDRPIPHGLLSLARWLLWMAIRGLLRLYLAVETGSIDGAAVLSQNMLVVAFK